MKYKYVFMDLDETSLIGHHVPKENIEAIEKAQALGVKFIPCTGRDLCMIQEILVEIHTHNQKEQYSICCNGAVVKENTGKVIYFQGIDPQDFKIFMEYIETQEGVVILFAQEGIFILRPNEFEVQRKIDQNSNPVVFEDFNYEYVKDLHIVKMMLSQTDLSKRDETLKNMPDILKEHCEITTSSGRYIEVNAKNVNKGNGMKALMAYLNDSLDTCVGVGMTIMIIG